MLTGNFYLHVSPAKKMKMMIRISMESQLALIALVGWFAIFPAPCIAQSFDGKKVILCGHDAPDSKRYLENLKPYGELPFSGFAIRLDASEEGVRACNNREPGRTAFSSTPWKKSWFNDSTKRLRKANEILNRDTFILFNCNPGDVDWFDDRGWAETADHFKVMAWAAKSSGSRGIIFDPEPYPSNKPIIPFSYERQKNRGQYTIEQYREKARQLGRECMRAMVSEYPDMVILSFFLTSYLTQDHTFRGPNAINGDSVQTQLAAHKYNLLIPFLTGWLEEASASLTIIDGNESAYYYTQEVEYQAAAFRISRLGKQLFPEKVQTKYDQVVQTGQSVYLDNCLPNHSLYTEIPNHSSQQILNKRLDWALRSTDQYVWIWAEGGRFLHREPGIPNKQQFRSKYPHWDEIFPGAIQIFRLFEQSETRVQRLSQQLEMDQKSKRAVPRIKNGNLKGQKRLDNWVIWQDPKTSFGKMKWIKDQSVVEIMGSAGGLIAQDLTVQPGQTIHVVATCTKQGEGEPYISVGILDGNKNHVKGSVAPPSLLRTVDPSTGELEIHGRWIVPEGCEILRILCGARSQGDEDDTVLIKEVQAFEILPDSQKPVRK